MMNRYRPSDLIPGKFMTSDHMGLRSEHTNVGARR